MIYYIILQYNIILYNTTYNNSTVYTTTQYNITYYNVTCHNIILCDTIYCRITLYTSIMLSIVIIIRRPFEEGQYLAPKDRVTLASAVSNPSRTIAYYNSILDYIRLIIYIYIYLLTFTIISLY